MQLLITAELEKKTDNIIIKCYFFKKERFDTMSVLFNNLISSNIKGVNYHAGEHTDTQQGLKTFFEKNQLLKSLQSKIEVKHIDI